MVGAEPEFLSCIIPLGSGRQLLSHGQPDPMLQRRAAVGMSGMASYVNTDLQSLF